MTLARILIVEDEFMIAEMLSAMIEDMGMSVCGRADTGDEAIRLAQVHDPVLILMDVRLKGSKDGVDAALAIRQHSAVPVIFLSGSREPEMVARIKTNRPAGLLFKPFLFEALRQIICRVLSDFVHNDQVLD